MQRRMMLGGISSEGGRQRGIGITAIGCEISQTAIGIGEIRL
jgi:hypothetical protein